MLRKLFFICILFSSAEVLSQYNFKGQIAEQQHNKTIYLSIIEDYRKFDRISMEQILKKATTDSLGNFSFSGNNLNIQNRVYRIHVDECSDSTSITEHFFGNCEYGKSVLFIANNTDSITFPTSFANEALCEISSTNNKSFHFFRYKCAKRANGFRF